MAVWTWSGLNWEKCPWHNLNKGNLKAMIYGCGPSLNSVPKTPEGYFRIVQNMGFKSVEPHVWLGMDDPDFWTQDFFNSPFRKVLRGSFGGAESKGQPVKDFSETYFIDVKAQNRDSVFLNRGLDCQFYWNKNTMQVAIHLALYMGFKTIAFAGIDLQGDYFDKRKLTPVQKVELNQLLKEEFAWMKWFAEVAGKTGINPNYIIISLNTGEEDLEVLPDHINRFPMVSLTKLEFKNKLKELDIYTSAKAILDALDEDKKEDWDLATCVDSDNEDILAVLSALNVSVLDVFYAQ